MKLSEHFSSVEAACRCGRDECEYSEAQITTDAALLATSQRTAEFMETVRTFLGNKPIHTNSWWRCEFHNDSVGGETNSFHKQGKAVDFTHRTLTPAQVQRKLSTQAGRPKVDGLGKYRSFTHVDRRGSRADWNLR